MKVIAGLGNPGPRYDKTRHNLGFMVLDELAARFQIRIEKEKHQGKLAQTQYRGEKLILVKPQTFMNCSGDCVAQVSRNKIFNLEDLLVVVDDIHLPLGRMRLRAGGSAGGHNGLKSLMERMGGKDFHRLRVGVGEHGPQSNQVDHVLSRFRPAEWKVVERMVVLAADAILCWVDQGIGPAMNEYNKRPLEEA